MNNHIPACRYRTFTDKFDNHVLNVVIRTNMLPRNLILKFYAFMTVNNENKMP